MAEVHGPGRAARLAVVTADTARPRRHKILAFFEKRGSTLARATTLPLRDDAAALDVCRLDPRSTEESVVVARPNGLYRVGEATPLARTSTLFAHAAYDTLPRMRFCFALFAGEPPALVVPTLAGVAVFRARAPGAPYQLAATLPADADVHYMWQALRVSDPASGQHLGVRLDYPEVQALDFDGDGRTDLCLSLGEALTCYLQDARGLSPAHARRFTFDLLTAAERADRSIRVESRLVPLAGPGKPPALVLKKSNWNVSAMGTSLYVFAPEPGGGFAGKPVQTLTRKGFFAYQDYRDVDGDGRLDLVAPTTALGWSDLAHIYFSKAVTLEFVWYKGDGRRFADAAQTLHALSYPVEFKDMGAVLGALPLWDVHVGAPVPGERQVAFFPGREAVEVFAIDARQHLRLVWQAKAAVGSAALATDLDGDGRSELVVASPRVPGQARQLLFLVP